VQVEAGAFLVEPLLLAIALLAGWPIALCLMTASFEKLRWAESDHAGGEE
jgi:hypothetical protein